MKGSKSKRSEKKERKRARKRFETGNGKKLPLPVNMENARQFGKFGFSFIASKGPFCMVSYFQKYTFKVPASSQFCEI